MIELFFRADMMIKPTSMACPSRYDAHCTLAFPLSSCPPPSFLVSVHPSGDLQEGTGATIRCQVNGASAQWKWPNGKSESPEVVLNSVSLSDNGIWECIISHEGKTFIESLEIRVKGKTLTSTHSNSYKITTIYPNIKELCPHPPGSPDDNFHQHCNC